MHSHLDIHTSVADHAKISTTHLQKSLAEAALKHVAGAHEVIERTFSTKSIEPELKPPRAINQLMYMGHTH